MAKGLQPGMLSIALLLSAPGPDDHGMEVAQPGYTRKLVNFLHPSDAPGALVNELTTEWPRATSLWGNIGWVAGYDLDGNYAGWGNIVSQLDGVTPIIERIDRGDVARFGATSIFLLPGYILPSPFGTGKYSSGPYSRGKQKAFINAGISAAFDPTANYPGALPSGCSLSASAWTVEALP